MISKITKMVIGLLITACSICTPAFAGELLSAEESSAEDELIMQKADMLKSINAVPNTFSADMLDTEVSRSKLAEYTVRMLGMHDISDNAGSTSLFTDVHPLSEGAGDIIIACNLKIMNGVGEGLFDPTSTAGFDQAVKTLVNAIGYRSFAEAKGGFPNGYMIVGYETEILKNVNQSTNGKLYYRSLIEMVFNAVRVDTYIKLSDSDMGKKDVCLLEKVYNVYKIENIITANRFTGLYSASQKTSEGYIVLNDELLETGDTSAEDYLGYRVTAYVSYGDNNDNGKILWLCPDTKKMNELCVEDRNIEGLTSSNDFEYYAGTKRYTARLSESANVIYNAEFVDKLYNADTELFTPESGSVKLIDYDNDGNYDVIFIEDFRYMIAGGVNESTKTVTDKVTGDELSLKEEGDKIIVLTKGGQNATLKSIAEGNVLEILRSKNGNILRINISASKAAGTVKSITDSILTIGAEEYEISGIIDIQSMRAGREGTFYMNSRRQVVYADFKAKNSGDLYGIMINCVIEDMLETRVSFKIFTHEGKVRVYEASKQLKVDSVRLSDTETTVRKSAVFSAGAAVPQVIIYRLDGYGLISMIDTKASNKNAGYPELTEDFEQASRKHYRNVFDARFSINSETVIFSITSFDGNTEDWEIVSPSRFQNNLFYDVAAYNVDEKHTAQALLYVAGNDLAINMHSTMISVVREFTQEYREEEDDAVNVVHCGYNSLTDKSLYYTDETAASLPKLEQGDVVQFRLFGDEIRNVNILIRKNSKYEYFTGDGISGLYGKVKAVSSADNIAVVDVGDEKEDLIVMNLSGTQRGYIYNREEETVEIAAFSKISIGDELYVKCYYAEPREYVIFKE